jgi:hypothetical protein
MGNDLGPHHQMVTLAQQSATKYEMGDSDTLDALIATVMDEIEPYLAFDTIDHSGFLNKIRGPLVMSLGATPEGRRREYLSALTETLHSRLTQL